MLRLLSREELSVGELSRALQLPQSTVSRHLKLLHDANLVARRQEGTASIFRMAESLPSAAKELWSVTADQLKSQASSAEDDHRLAVVLAERRGDNGSFFGRLGSEWDALRRELFGESFPHEALLHLLDHRWIVADLGCGTGNVSELLAPVVRRVIAVDREPAMLDTARLRLQRATNVELRQGDLLKLPIDDASNDAAVVFLVMIHLDDPAEAVGEVSRVLRPGGVALIVDMVPHEREEYRRTMGHVHLGFAEADVQKWAERSSMALGRWSRLKPDTQRKGPALFAATLRKPALSSEGLGPLTAP
jgi:ArsR family transcriptional regulator